jgi:1,4-dihydroxy-6-naphthoate synthase
VKTALSPCPNDTYLFYAWLNGRIGDKQPNFIFADIQQLNAWALRGIFPLTKLSFYCFSKALQHYQLLPVGSALGFGCGPKIIARHYFDPNDLHKKSIAIPGKETTAHRLLEILFNPPKEKLFCLYHEVYNLIAHGKTDCGLIIHESRFTFKDAGFVEIADLGQIWHAKTGLPLPLGGLAISRALTAEVKNTVVNHLQDSLHYAQAHPEETFKFILEHSQEKKIDVVKQHIATYVNSETETLSPAGIQALNLFFNLGPTQSWLYQRGDACNAEKF